MRSQQYQCGVAFNLVVKHQRRRDWIGIGLPQWTKEPRLPKALPWKRGPARSRDRASQNKSSVIFRKANGDGNFAESFIIGLAPLSIGGEQGLQVIAERSLKPSGIFGGAVGGLG